MENKRIDELLKMVQSYVDEGHCLRTAINNMEGRDDISRDEFIEIESTVGAGARYVYNGLYNCHHELEPDDDDFEEDGVFFDTPVGAHNNMALLDNQLAEMPHVDPRVAYENALDACAGMCGLWDE